MTATEGACQACSRLGNVQVLADLRGEQLIDFPVTGDGRGFTRCAVDVQAVRSTLPQQLAPVFLEMPKEVPALHAARR